MSLAAEKTTMRAAVWTAPDSIETRNIALPEVPDGWALVRSEMTGLCGSDFSILHGTHPRAEAPLVMGHEITGVVEAAGDLGPAAGTRVTVEPLIHCGECHPCSAGDTHVCRALKLYGIDVAGSLAEFVALPGSALIPISDTVPLPEAALAEPLAVAVHAVSRSGLAGGERVVVFGAGPIGVLTALVARHQGAGSVLISEPSEARRQVAEELGFDTVAPGEDPVQAIVAATAGDGADIVFDTAAHPAVAAMLPQAVRVRGTIVLVGVYKKPVELDLQAITFAENTLVGVRVYTRAAVERAVALIEAGELGLDRVPTQVFALEDTAAAFEQAMSAGRVLKVLVSPAVAPATQPQESR
jgi:2-desacetyl-2-hydroxyethyl bacteriochlorophyllide A dehydrogenase